MLREAADHAEIPVPLLHLGIMEDGFAGLRWLSFGNVEGSHRLSDDATSSLF